MHDLYIEFRVFDNFAVEFETAVVKRFNRDFLCGVFAAPVRADVLAFEELEKAENDFSLFHFADVADVQKSVVDNRVRTNGNAAADKSAVAYAYHKHARVFGYAVRRYAKVVESRVQKRVEKRIIIRRFTLQSFAICVFEQHVNVHTAAAYVEATIFAEFHIVDVTDFAVENGLRRFLDVGGMTGFFDKIVSASARDKTERDVVEVIDAAKHFVERAVAAHNHDVRIGRLGQFFGDFGCVSCVFRFMNDVLGVVILEDFLDGCKRFHTLALSALRIDDYVIHNALRCLFVLNIQAYFNTYAEKVNLLQVVRQNVSYLERLYGNSIAVFKLQFVEFVVVPLVFKQLLVRAFLDDSAVLKHDYLVGVLDCREPVRNDEHSADIADIFKGLLDYDFGFGVDVCGCLVENENLRLMKHRSCKRKKLALTLREVFAALYDFLVESVFLRRYEGVGVDVLARRLDFLVGERFVVEGDIASHRAAEKEYVLKHLPYSPAQRMDFYGAYISAVNKDLTFLYLVIAHDEGKNRSFSRARRAYERARFLRIYGERHVFENPVLVLVGKPHVLKLDFALEFVHRHGVFSVADFGFYVEQVEQSFGSGGRLLQVVELVGKVLYRVEEP